MLGASPHHLQLFDQCFRGGRQGRKGLGTLPGDARPRPGAHGITYSALISACAKSVPVRRGDKAARALELFQAMRDSSLVPTAITCSALISAYTKGDKAARA